MIAMCPWSEDVKPSRVAGRKRMTMKLRAKLVYVRDHDLDQGEKGLQKILHFQTAGLGDARFTLLTHTGEHAGGPVPTVKHRMNEDGSCGTLSRAEVAKHVADGARISITNQHHQGASFQELTIAGDEGKEYEIEIREVVLAPAAAAK
jgi:hypothetical protein